MSEHKYKCCGVVYTFESLLIGGNQQTCHKCSKPFEPTPAIPSNARPSRPEDRALHAVKYDAGKPRLELVPPRAMTAMGLVLGYGAAKYGEHNYLKGMAWGRLAGASMRHTFSWLMGEDKDPESGLPHLYHALASLAMLIETVERGVGLDDRYKDPNAS